MKYIFCFIQLTIVYISYSQGDIKRNFESFKQGYLLSTETGRFENQSVEISNKAYDDGLFAVFCENSSGLKSETMVSKGIAEVRVNKINGQIKKGDPITSSTINGIGMKATISGTIIGFALEELTSNEGLIKVRIQPSYYKQEK